MYIGAPLLGFLLVLVPSRNCIFKLVRAVAVKAARLDIAYRDYCAHLLIPLNKCRHETFYLPWKCGHERHTYEKCQYVEYVFLRRVRPRSAQRSVPFSSL